MNAFDWLAFGSLLAAWVAAIMAYKSWLVAQRSLEFVEEQALGTRPHIVPYLVDGFVASDGHTHRRIYAFSLAVSNRSNVDDSLSNIDLLLTYFRPGQPLATLVLPHDAQLRPSLIVTTATVLSATERIPAHHTVTGWIICAVDEPILNGAIIDSYQVRLTDSNGTQSTLKPLVMRELVDEKVAKI